MINPTCQRGFVLPFTLLLSSALLVLATLLLKHGEFRFEQGAVSLAHLRARQTLTENAHVIRNYIENVLSDPSATTFLVDRGHPAELVNLTNVYLQNGINSLTLASISPENDSLPVNFVSPVSGTNYGADLIRLSDDDQSASIQIAWAAEDISLATGIRNSAIWWPLPQWQMSPFVQDKPLDHLFHDITGSSVTDIEWIPQNEPIPFTPQNSPAFTPVVTSARLKFGIFASGNVGHREKVVRIRFYLECGLWNPYNRTLRFHGRSNPAPQFQLVFWNLPKFRINNLSKGISTGWMEMDELINSQTGAEGFHGWIRVKGVLEPGEYVVIREPDSKNQPEGLARTVHPAFMTGPADRIQIEFQQNQKGCSIACLSLEEDLPLASAKTGNGWFRIEDFPVEIPNMEFNRADDPNRPFYLAAGSLSFREDHTQIQINATRPAARLTGSTDPRQKIFNQNAYSSDSAGRSLPDKDLIDVDVVNLRKNPSDELEEVIVPALFSWPDRPPESLMALSDIPEWDNAFRIGAENAYNLNSILDRNWPINTQDSLIRTSSSGQYITYQHSLPINSISTDAWYRVFEGSRMDGVPSSLRKLALYPNPIEEGDFLHFRDSVLKEASKKLSSFIRSNPSFSISDFFNKGTLFKAFDLSSENPLHQLFPLRGLNGKGIRLVPRGSAFILHLACFKKHDDMTIIKTARIWLLEAPAENALENLEVVRFEWTDPSTHMAKLN